MVKTTFVKSRTTKSLAGASLEMGRVLADCDGVTFRAKGTCMYPTIRAGDVLRIQSRAAAEVSVGDIAVCRRPPYLLSHRVIDKGVHEGRAYIVTRHDRACEGSDGPTFDEDLLGVVTSLERRGKRVPLQPTAYSWPVRRYHALCLALIEGMSMARYWGTDVLARMQNNSLYRRIARGWLVPAGPRISYTVRLPMPGLGDAVYRELSPEMFDVRMDWRGRRIERWTLTLHLNGKRRPAAWATFARDAAQGWHVDELFVSVLYRGAGLDEDLLRRADAILLRRHGAPEGRESGEINDKSSRSSVLRVN